MNTPNCPPALTGARNAVARGWRVIPVYPMRDTQMCGCGKTTCTDSKGKHPIGAKWQERASTDPAKVATWARHNHGCNWGTATGIESNLYVVDLDLGKDGEPLGEQTWTELFGPIPDTHRVRTGSGAMQLYFRYPHRPRADGKPWRNTTKLIGDGIDTRGEGGQCVLPGSVSGKGPYELIADRPLLAMPDALLDHIETAEHKAKDTPKPNSRERRAAAVAIASAVDFSRADDGLHRYAAKAFRERIAEFRALAGSGNGRTYLLTGGAKYLNGMASDPISGLTEKMIRDAFTEACHANGYAHTHSDWEYQLDRGLADGRGVIPPNWKPSEYDKLLADIPNILAGGDQERIEALTAALGPEEIAAFRARAQRATSVAVAPTSVAVAAIPAQASPAAVLASTPHPPAGGTATEATAAPAGTVTTEPPTDVPFDTLAPSDQEPRPTVIVKGRDFSELRKQIQLNLGTSNAFTKWIFLHGNDLVVSGRGALQVLDQSLFVSKLADRMAFIETKFKDGVPTQLPADPPTEVIKAIRSDRANLALPEVDRIAHTPFFGPDGTLQRTPGYHEKARTLYVPTPGIDIPDIPDSPTDQQVEAAHRLILDELLGDFPFTSDAELAGAVALGITPFIRTMIDGPTPLFALDAPEPRTGKGLLMEVLLTPSSGRKYTVTPAPTEPREWPKAIVASLRPGPVAAIFDNANARIDSGALASAVTAYPSYTSRLLGLSENVDMPLPAVWVMTGDNIVCSTEIAGRVVRIRLDARMQRPGERSGFRHPNLRRWASEHQGDIIAAFLTLVQAWIAAGQPRGVDPPAMGGFEDWVGIVGSILAFHGIGGLLTNRDSLIDTMTDEAMDWGGLIGMMAAMTAEATETARQRAENPTAGREPGVPGDPGLPAAAAAPEPEVDPLATEWTALQLVNAMIRHAVVPPVDLGPCTALAQGQAHKLAKALRAHRDRRFGDAVLRHRTLHGKAVWRLDGVT